MIRALQWFIHLQYYTGLIKAAVLSVPVLSPNRILKKKKKKNTLLLLWDGASILHKKIYIYI